MNTGKTAKRRLALNSIYVVVLSAAAVVLACKGISDEGTISLHGDMPRHMMNGVYFYDVLRDLPLTNFVEYTHRYFAQYPALSLGHHPILIALAEVPFYALLGISVSSARWTIILFLLLGVTTWFLLISWQYNERVAFLSSLLFITSPMVVEFSRIVMTEIPTLALIIVSAYFFFRFYESGEKKYQVAFILSFTLACYAKQLAIFMLPVFVLHFAIGKGVRRLFEKEAILTFLAIGVLLAPLLAMTLHFSPTNVGFVTGQAVSDKLQASKLLFYIQGLWRRQLSLPLVGLSLLSIGVVLLRRQMRFAFFLLWIVALYGLVVYLGAMESRLTIYWVPAFSLFAALSAELLPSRAWRVLLTGIVAILIGYQFVNAYAAEPEYAVGYEEAASYVVENRKGATVMFSSTADTGYFVFFVRKRDPLRQMVVLRADKVLATSKLDWIVEERISGPAEIYPILRDFGTCYVVLEDTPYKSRSIEWLRAELNSDRFVSRQQIPIRSRDTRLQGVSLGIYEYKDCSPANPDAVLDLRIPLVGDSIQVKLGEIMRGSPR